VFLLNHIGAAYCPVCRERSEVITEGGHIVGDSNRIREARVEFDYKAKRDEYGGIAIVIDTAMEEGGVYHFHSPLIRTEKRALKVAEAFLANLNLGLDLNEYGVAPSKEHELYIDREDYHKRLAAMAKLWSSYHNQEEEKVLDYNA
jgi:hypothetical protein